MRIGMNACTSCNIAPAGLRNADGGAFFAFIPKSKLLDIIERQINKDPEAIKYIAEKQK
jgi:hypothetical protein